MWQLMLSDVAATSVLANALAATQPLPVAVHLQGNLGAGKSTLARAWLRALGVTGTIRSPTYTLVEPYVFDAPRTGDARRALHLDLYRIGNAGELEFLALDDSAIDLWLVEWPERGAAALPPADLTIALQIAGQGRSALLTAATAAGREWLVRLQQKIELRQYYELTPQEVSPASG